MRVHSRLVMDGRRSSSFAMWVMLSKSMLIFLDRGKTTHNFLIASPSAFIWKTFGSSMSENGSPVYGQILYLWTQHASHRGLLAPLQSALPQFRRHLKIKSIR